MLPGIFDLSYITTSYPPISIQNDQPEAFNNNLSSQATDSNSLAWLTSTFFPNTQPMTAQNRQSRTYSDQPLTQAAEITPVAQIALSTVPNDQPIIYIDGNSAEQLPPDISEAVQLALSIAHARSSTPPSEENQFDEARDVGISYTRRYRRHVTTATHPDSNLRQEARNITDTNSVESINTSARVESRWIMNANGDYENVDVIIINKRRKKTTITETVSAVRPPRARPAPIPDDQRFEVVDLTDESMEGSNAMGS